MDIFVLIIYITIVFLTSSLIVAYTYSNKIYLNLESKKENVSSYTLKILTENPRLYISSLKLANGFFLVLFSYSFFITYLEYNQNNITSDNYFRFWFMYVFLLFGVLYIFGKFLPQVFVKPFSNLILTQYDWVSQIFIRIFSPIASPLNKIADFLLKKIWGLSQSRDVQLLSISDLGTYISKQMESVQEQEDVDTELQILKNALAFTDVKAREIMTPRVEIEAVSLYDNLDLVKEKFTETGYSKLLVYDEKPDNIVGYMHLFELFKKPTCIQDIMYPIEIVAESAYIKELFQNLSVKRKSVAIVVDEYGGLSGMITIEDIIEELFGEIDDEHDNIVEHIEKKINDKRYIFSARLEVSYLNEKYHLEIPESDEYNTIGGFILHNLNNIPKKGTVLNFDHLKFKILASSDKKIDIIDIRLP